MILTHNQIIGFSLSCDEGSSVWKADLQLADRAAYAAVGLRDVVSLSFGGDTFSLIVDGKTLGREFDTETFRVSAVSPLALLDAPFAATRRAHYPAPTLARQIVTDQLGAVDWQLPEWSVPAGACAFDKATPLAIAKSVVESIGGLVESKPDGSVLCRLRYPVSIPSYATATPDRVFTDADLIASTGQLSARATYNRVLISNSGQTSALGDTLEQTGSLVRGYPSPWRAVRLLHTGGPQVRIEPSGVVVRTEIERVEFIDGKASTRYAVLSLLSVGWQQSLGTVAADGKALTAASGGYSLADITYQTRAFEWRVYDPANGEVQFIMVDS